MGLGGMGAPTVFSVQTHVDYLLPFASANLARYRTGDFSLYPNVQSSAYGDDIAVKGLPTQCLFEFMEALGMKPNATKSFDNEYFRESCGCWVYKDKTGKCTDVTPVFWPRKEFDLSSQDGLVRSIVRLIEHARSLLTAGYEDAARAVGKFIYSKVNLPNHSDVGSDVRLPIDLHFNNYEDVSYWSVKKGVLVSHNERWSIESQEISREEWANQVIKIGNRMLRDVRSIMLGTTFVLCENYLARLGIDGKVNEVFTLTATGEWALTIHRGVRLEVAKRAYADVPLSDQTKSVLNDWMYHNFLVRDTDGYKDYHINVPLWKEPWEVILDQLIHPTKGCSLRQLRRLPSEVRFVNDYSDFSFVRK